MRKNGVNLCNIIAFIVSVVGGLSGGKGNINIPEQKVGFTNPFSVGGGGQLQPSYAGVPGGYSGRTSAGTTTLTIPGVSLDVGSSIILAVAAGSGGKMWGDCDDAQYQPLKQAMETACKSGKITGCKKDSLKQLRRRLRQSGQSEKEVIITQAHIQDIINNNLACEQARQNIQDTCYSSSPDTEHQNQINQLQINRNECVNILPTFPTE